MSMPEASLYLTRQERLTAILCQAGLDALILNASPTLRYFTGLHFHLNERPVTAAFTRGGEVTFILPELELGKLESSPFTMHVVTYGEDPSTWASVFQTAINAISLPMRRVGVEPRRLRMLELRLLESALPSDSFIPAEELIAELRMIKDAAELVALRKAVKIAEQALQATLTHLKLGMTEAELAAELTLQMLRHGSESNLPFAPVVACGENSANPHHVPGGRVLQPGDLLLFDWGATYQGYVSDLTRTFAVGSIDPELNHIAQVVLEANHAARLKAAPGVPAGEVDSSARQVIEAAGYGDYFTHRLGHGYGLEEHEPPYLRSDNPLLLQAGMTFTVEPGIYLTGRGGVRIEDDCLITSEGLESLSTLPRELITLDL